MRRVLLGMASALVASQAFAADYLRGSVFDAPPTQAGEYNWAGVYFGGQSGWTNNNYDFTGSTRDLVGHMLRLTTIEEEARVSDWPNLRPRDSRGASYGAFVGYNTQWGQAVMGLEVNYNRTSQTVTSSDSIGRSYTASDEYTYNIFVTSSASMKLTDYGSLRLRVGYAWDWVLPYATIGVAAARADVSRSARVLGDFVDSRELCLSEGICRPGGVINDAISEVKNGQIGFGYTAGFGVDIGLMPGVFVRGEYEFMQIGKIGGIQAQINTARLAAALKF